MNAKAVRGGAAGAVGVVAMDVVTWLLYRRESTAELVREKRARTHGKDTAHALVQKVTEAAGSDAGAQQPNGAGIAVHYGLGWDPERSTPTDAGSTRGCAPAVARCTGLACSS